MLDRKTLENDFEVKEALSSWGAGSISGLASFVLAQMYKAESSNRMNLLEELKKHADYFNEKSGVDLISIVGGLDFYVDKQIFLDFSKNCLDVCRAMGDSYDKRGLYYEIKRDIEELKSAILRIETAMMVNSWVSNSAKDLIGDRILGIGALLSPVSASGIRKVRVGRQGDGGYVMLDDFGEVDGALSFGVNDDDSWDMDIANRGIDVHQYDHTIGKSPTSNDRLFFFREKITGKSDPKGTSIDDAADRIDGRNLILKCDIEGSEWDVFAEVDAETIERFSQVVCEFHGFGSVLEDNSYAKIDRALRKLDGAFSVVHVHANNSGPLMLIAGVPFPSVLEVTYASKSRYKFEETKEIFPTNIDCPNAESLPELYLGRFQYRKVL